MQKKVQIPLKKSGRNLPIVTYLEGYGLTETSPGISFNLPGNGSRKGSVGKLFTSIECKTIHPETNVSNLGENPDSYVFEVLIFLTVTWMKLKKQMKFSLMTDGL